MTYVGPEDTSLYCAASRTTPPLTTTPPILWNSTYGDETMSVVGARSAGSSSNKFPRSVTIQNVAFAGDWAVASDATAGCRCGRGACHQKGASGQPYHTILYAVPSVMGFVVYDVVCLPPSAVRRLPRLAARVPFRGVFGAPHAAASGQSAVCALHTVEPARRAYRPAGLLPAVRTVHADHNAMRRIRFRSWRPAFAR